MENLTKSVPLRPRFTAESKQSVKILLQRLSDLKESRKGAYKIIISDYQVWIHLHPSQRAYYSPHLQFELQPQEQGTHIRALFGPDPTLWTFFMFLHFGVAMVFLSFGVLAYSHYILKESTQWDFIMMGAMVIVWFLLYFIARIIRNKGVPQMCELKIFFDEVIR